MHKTQPKKFKRTPRTKHIRPTEPLEEMVLNTLRYRKVFGCPMSFYQICNYLICTNPKHNNMECFSSCQELKSLLIEMVKSGRIILKDGLYAFGKVDVSRAKESYKHARKLKIEAERICVRLKHLPWIEMVAITGSVAAHNAGKDADIDLLFVTKPRRVWLTRLFLVPMLKLQRVYLNSSKPAGTICPNIIMSTNSMAWKTAKRNVYTASEASMIYPLFYRDDAYFRFLDQNKWLRDYLPNFPIPSIETATYTQTLIGRIIDALDDVAEKLQTRYMNGKKTTEIVSKDFIHFNTHDSSSDVLNKYSLLA